MISIGPYICWMGQKVNSRHKFQENNCQKKFPLKSSTSSIDDGKYHFRKIALEKNLYEFPTATYVVYVLLLTLGLIRPLLLRRLVEFSRPQKNDHSKAKFRAAEKAQKRSTELQSSRIDWHLRIMVQTPDRIKHSLLELPPSLLLM